MPEANLGLTLLPGWLTSWASTGGRHSTQKGLDIWVAVGFGYDLFSLLAMGRYPSLFSVTRTWVHCHAKDMDRRHSWTWKEEGGISWRPVGCECAWLRPTAVPCLTD